VLYDHPPHILFGQKAPLILPFIPETTSVFDSEIRELLVYTVPVVPTGIQLEEGEISLDAFSRRSRRDREYFLKYAGCDVSINWGSRAVYYLGNVGKDECLRRLEEAARQTHNGSLWVLQPRVEMKTSVNYLAKSTEEHRTEDMTAKFSTFYGPSGPLSVVAQFRSFYKVHGQPDTVMTLCL